MVVKVRYVEWIESVNRSINEFDFYWMLLCLVIYVIKLYFGDFFKDILDILLFYWFGFDLNILEILFGNFW